MQGTEKDRFCTFMSLYLNHWCIQDEIGFLRRNEGEEMEETKHEEI
jgi:hypothetical protein